MILFTRDYEQSSYTRKEFTSFEAQRHQSLEERHVIVLRCEDVPVEGLLADNIFQDLVGVTDPEERKGRIVAAAERQSLSALPPPKPFIGVPPRIASFTGRADDLDKLDAILMGAKPAAVTQSAGRAAVQGLGGVKPIDMPLPGIFRAHDRMHAGCCRVTSGHRRRPSTCPRKRCRFTAARRGPAGSGEMNPIGRLCSLQLCDRHTNKRDSVMRVRDDHRASAGVMRMTEHERRCGLCEQSVIKRKLILIGVEVCDSYLTEALIEYKSFVSCPADQCVILPHHQEIVSAPTG